MPWASKRTDTETRGSATKRVPPAELVEGGVELGPRLVVGGVADAAPEQLADRRRPSAVTPEVEQAAGDDVALDLGGAAVDRRRPRVEVLGAPVVGGRIVAEQDVVGEGVGDQVEQRLLGRGEEDLVDRGLGAELAARRQAVLGRARERARNANTIWASSPTVDGSSASGAAASRSCWSRRCR